MLAAMSWIATDRLFVFRSTPNLETDVLVVVFPDSIADFSFVGIH